MSNEILKNNLENKEILDDNARKFLTDTIDPQFLEHQNATSFTLTTNWLKTGADHEEKLAHKDFGNGNIQILLIKKVTKGGNRTSEKQSIDKGEYERLLPLSTLHAKKRRYEFSFVQNDTPFSIKYDEFSDSDLRLLEVDAASDQERDIFSPNDFPYKLTEVTGDLRYYGYRVTETT